MAPDHWPTAAPSIAKVSRPLAEAEDTIRQKENSPADPERVTLSVLLLFEPIAPDCAAKLPAWTTLDSTVQLAGESPADDNCQGNALKFPLSKPSEDGATTMSCAARADVPGGGNVNIAALPNRSSIVPPLSSSAAVTG